MSLYLDPSRGDSDAIAYAIGDEVVRVASAHLLSRALDDNPDENLVVIGADCDLAGALAIANEYRMRRPALGVVLLRQRIDVTIMSQALQAGVREVVLVEDLQGLSQACRRSREISARQLGTVAETGEGTVVTVFSSKGGCGKTTIAINMAVALVANLKQSVILVDLDLQFGDVGITLGLSSRPNIGDGVAMLDDLDATSLKSLIQHHSSGVDCLLAPLSPAEVEGIPAELITQMIQVLRGMYDYIVIDSPPAFSDTILAALDLSDTYILVATPDIPALKNLRITLDTFDDLGYPRSAWQVVLNRGDVKNGLEMQDIEDALGTNVHLVIPQSSDVSKTANRGVPIVTVEPSHGVSKAMVKLARMQRGLAEEAVGARATARNKRSRGLFRGKA